MTIERIPFFTLFALLLASLVTLPASEVRGLQCEDLTSPLGIDAKKPRLNWRIESTRRGEWQRAYQILVASTPELLAANRGDFWDSGKVRSDQSTSVEYAGKPLESRVRCYWKARIWDRDGKVTEWSQPATWTVGLLKAEDWSAKWITASRWFMPLNLRPPGLVISRGGWADVDLGEPFPIDSIRLYFSNTNTAPKRFKILGANDLEFSNPQILVDQSAADYQPIGAGPQVFVVNRAKFRRIRLWLISP